jgi:subtilase family serine protease
MTKLKSILALLGVIAATAAFAKPSTGTPDLLVSGITFKTKCDATTCTVNNVTTYVSNVGEGDADSSKLEYYLSNDDVLTTDPLSPDADVFIHAVSMGKVKAGKIKKRTLGGGLLKQANMTMGQYLFVVLDADQQVTELSEDNNTTGVVIQ